jgi:hypothetical protein
MDNICLSFTWIERMQNIFLLTDYFIDFLNLKLDFDTKFSDNFICLS